MGVLEISCQSDKIISRIDNGRENKHCFFTSTHFFTIFLPSHLNSDFTSAFGFFVSAEKKNNASTIIIRILCIQ